MGNMDWPDGVQPVSVENLSYLGMDDKGQVYWQGKLLVTRNKLTLEPLEKFYALIIVLAELIMALSSVISLYR